VLAAVIYLFCWLIDSPSRAVPLAGLIALLIWTGVI
jgi:hypothetical protein